jgi:hypothetical protein
MKIFVTIPETSTLKGDSAFKTGKLYRCTKTAENYPEYKNCVAWKQRESQPSLGLLAGLVFAVLDGTNEINGAFNGLKFNRDFEFEELPAGSKIEVQTSITIPLE